MELITLRETARYHLTLASFLMAGGFVLLVTLLSQMEAIALLLINVALLAYCEGYWVMWLITFALQAYIVSDPAWFSEAYQDYRKISYQEMLKLDAAWLLFAFAVNFAKKGFRKNNKDCNATLGAHFYTHLHQAFTLVFYSGCCLMALVPLGMFPQIQDRAGVDADYISAGNRSQIWLYTLFAGFLSTISVFGFYKSSQ